MGARKWDDEAILDFMAAHKRLTGGKTPTVREVQVALGMSSSSVAAYRLAQLVQRGKLIRGEGGHYQLPGERYVAPGDTRRIPLVVLMEILRATRQMVNVNGVRLADPWADSLEVEVGREVVERLRAIAAQDPALEDPVATWVKTELG